MEETLTAQQRAAQRTIEQYGAGHFAKIGARGGKATLERHGKEHLRAAGRKGGARMRQLLELGKAVEAEHEK